MDFIREVHGDVLVEVVNISRATLKEAEEFKTRLVEDINEGWRRVVIDLTECEFIDSTFLGTLVVSLKKLATLGGDLRLIGFQPSVHTMFELTRLSRVFESYETKEEALDSFKTKNQAL
jgi:anti-anti-sigma factor